LPQSIAHKIKTWLCDGAAIIKYYQKKCKGEGAPWGARAPCPARTLLLLPAEIIYYNYSYKEVKHNETSFELCP
jgi:hypothetical protein